MNVTFALHLDETLLDRTEHTEGGTCVVGVRQNGTLPRPRLSGDADALPERLERRASLGPSPFTLGHLRVSGIEEGAEEAEGVLGHIVAPRDALPLRHRRRRWL